MFPPRCLKANRRRCAKETSASDDIVLRGTTMFPARDLYDCCAIRRSKLTRQLRRYVLFDMDINWLSFGEVLALLDWLVIDSKNKLIRRSSLQPEFGRRIRELPLLIIDQTCTCVFWSQLLTSDITRIRLLDPEFQRSLSLCALCRTP